MTPLLAELKLLPVRQSGFSQLLDQTPDLDMRDNRGKPHSVALVLTGLVAALCCGRDGNLSRLYRHMVNQFESLLEATQREISRFLGSLRTLVVNLLSGLKGKNMTAQLETFTDKFPILIRFPTQEMVL